MARPAASCAVKPGDSAVFKIAGGAYFCTNHGLHFSCVSGLTVLGVPEAIGGWIVRVAFNAN